MFQKLLSAETAAGPLLTNTTAETVLGSYAFPAGFLGAAKVITGRAVVRSLSVNSTNTLAIRARLGGTTLTGTAVVTTAAVAQAAGDVCVIDFELVCRSPGDSAAAVVVASATANDPDAPGTATKGYAAIVTALDLTAPVFFEITGVYSAAHADNQCQLESLTLFEAA